MIPAIRLVFLDVDGTLVGTDEVVSERTRQAIRRAEDLGCKFVLSTARNRHSVQHIADQAGQHSFAILCNGAIVENWETGETIQRITLSRSTLKTAVGHAHAFGLTPLCFGAELDGGRIVYTDHTDTLPAPFVEREAHRLVFRSDLTTELLDMPVSLSAYGPAETAQAVARDWRRAFGTRVSVYDGASPRNGCWVAYCTPADTSKAHAAQTACDRLGIAREQTLAIGDGLNDVELLRWAGSGVCMGDGHSDVQSCADRITGTLADEGAAQAIEELLLDLEP